jgi:hypothetical protein
MTTRDPESRVHRFLCSNAGELSSSGLFEVAVRRLDDRVFEEDEVVVFLGGLFPSCVMMNVLGAPRESDAITLMGRRHWQEATIPDK